MNRLGSVVHLLALALFGAPAAAIAQGEEALSSGPTIGGGTTLTLDAVLASVERHHPTLLVARQRVRAAEGEVLSSEGAFDLSLVADGFVAPVGYYDWGRASVGLEQPTPLWGARFYAGWRVGRGTVPGYYGERETLDGGELRVGARIPLWRDGPIDEARARRGRARQQTESERASFFEDRLSLRLEGATAYHGWVAAGRKYLITLRLLEIADARRAQIDAKVTAGHLPAIEALENRRVVVARQTSLVSARRALERAAIALSLYLRDRAGQPRVPRARELPETPDIPGTLRVDLDRAMAEAWARRPESARYEASARSRRIDIELAENRRAPRIDLGIGAALDVGSGTLTEQETLGPATVEASLSFALPLQMREARGAVVRTRAELEGLDAEARLVRDRVEARVRDAHSAIRAAEESAALAREAATVAGAVAQAERTRFELGATQLFIVNLREEAAAAAEAIVVEAEAALQVAHARWRAATGGGSE